MKLLLCLLLAGDAAPAGAEYVRGLVLLKQGKLTEAVNAFEQALRHEPAETQDLKYRNPQGRHRHSYYPHFLIGETRYRLAVSETDPYGRRTHLQAALRGLGRTSHPGGKPLRAKAAALLEKTEERIKEIIATTPPPELAPLQKKVDQLCEIQNFVQAFREIEDAGDLFNGFERVRDSMKAQVSNRQRAAVRNYDVILSSRLESISRTDPTYESEIILPLLKPARVPAEVTSTPAPRFGWLDEFYLLYEKELERIRTAEGIPLEDLLAMTEAFEMIAGKALSIDLFTGFRASRNMAHSMRLARLKAMALAAEKPGSDLPGSDVFQEIARDVLRVADEALARVEKELRGRIDNGADGSEKKYLDTDIPYQKRQLDVLRGKIRELSIAYERRVSAESTARTAEEGLSTPEVMSDPTAVRGLIKPLDVLEAQPYFETLPAAVRARVLYARAVAEAMAVFLDAGTVARAMERCRPDVNKSFALDENVDARWTQTGRLSPRIGQVFKDIRR